MAEAYCVKDKKKVEVQNAAEDHHEERQAGDPGHLPGVRREGLPHRRLTGTNHAKRHRAPADGGGLATSGDRDTRCRHVPLASGPSGPSLRGIRPAVRDLPFGTIGSTLDPGGPAGSSRYSGPIATSDLTIHRSRPATVARRSTRPGGPIMATRVGINGFGRIGRQSLKALIERAPDVEVVAVNDLVDAEMNALLFKHDSTYGTYPGDVRAGDASIIIDGREIKILAESDPATLPWGDLGVDIVLESTGIFTDADEGRAPISTPARRRSSSAPRPRARTSPIVLGVNEDSYDPASHHIISNASCTTNCLAPAAKVVHDLVTIERGLMNTIHSYTNDQRILDVAHKDPRRARSAGQNIIPTTTGAAKALALVIPDLKGKFDGFSLRVPDADRQRRRLHRRRRAGRPRSRS